MSEDWGADKFRLQQCDGTLTLFGACCLMSVAGFWITILMVYFAGSYLVGLK